MIAEMGSVIPHLFSTLSIVFHPTQIAPGLKGKGGWPVHRHLPTFFLGHLNTGAFSLLVVGGARL